MNKVANDFFITKNFGHPGWSRGGEAQGSSALLLGIYLIFPSVNPRIIFLEPPWFHVAQV